MKTPFLLAVAVLCVGCDSTAGVQPGASAASPTGRSAAAQPTPTEAPLAADDQTVAGVASRSPDHTTLIAAVKAAGLVDVLASPGGVYTVFAPTNAAFDKLPKGTVEGLLKPEKKPDLRLILQHHVAVPVKQLKDLHDGEVMGMSDGTKVTIHVKDGKVKVDDANVIATVQAMNGVIHVVDAVILPPAK